MKRYLILFISILSVFFCIFGFTACDGSVDSVGASCVFDNDELTLPVKFAKAYTGGSYDYFIPTDSCSLEGIKSDVEALSGNDANYICEIYNDDCLFIEKTGGIDLHYYLVIRTDVYYYFLSPLRWYSEEKRFILFPYHLTYLTDADFQSYFHDEIDSVSRYRINGTKKQFKDFYGKLNLFDIIEENDTLEIKLKDGYEPPQRKYFNYEHIQTAFTITFGEDEEGEYAVYSIYAG